MLVPSVVHRTSSQGRRITRMRGAVLGLAVLLWLSVPLGVALAQETTTTSSTGQGVASGASETTAAAGSAEATGTAGSAQPGVAAGPQEFATLNPGVTLGEQIVTVLPEYDTTSTEILVFVDLTLPDTVMLPATFKFVVPGNARVTGFAQVTEQGGYDYNRPNPQFEAVAGYTVVTVVVPTYRKIHLEYYYNPGPGMPAQGAKDYPVTYTVSADTSTLYVYSQEPKRAEGFTVEPEAALGSPAADGYRYAQKIYSGLKSGDQATVQVSYTKNDADTSETPAGGQTEQQQQGASWLLWVVIAVVLIVVAFVGYRVFFAGRGSAGGGGRKPQGGQAKQRGRGAGGGKPASAGARGKSEGSDAPRGAPAKFCTQCGARLSKKDRFCPECGHEREL
jgi:hypothetical protein